MWRATETGGQQNGEIDQDSMRMLSAVIERCPGAHSQAESLDELQANLQEVMAMLLEDG